MTVRDRILPMVGCSALSRRAALGGALGAGVAAAAPRPARAADGRRRSVYMIVWRGETDVERGFQDYLREHDVPVDLIIRDAQTDVRRVSQFVEEIRSLRPDLVYTWGTSATLPVLGEYDADPRKYIRDIPVVFTLVSSPEKARIVPSRARPGGNATGTSHIVPLATQLAALRTYRPFTRLAVVYNPLELNSVIVVRELESFADKERWSLVAEAVPLDDSGRPMAAALPDVLARVAAEQPQFLYLGPDSFLGQNRIEVARLALELRLATYCATESLLVGTDALLGLVSRYYNLGRLTARKAEQILMDGVNPGLIPVDTLKRFSYVINTPTARALELYPPMSVLDFAEMQG